MKPITWMAAVGLALGSAAHAASYDCAKAHSKVERMICADAQLSRLDEELAAAYEAVLKFNNKATFIHQEQKQWLKERNSCTDEGCLKNVYAARVQQLNTANTTGYRMLEGNGYTICEEVFKRMNEALARKPQGPVCGYDVLRSIPGVALPDWAPLDLHEHKAVYKRYALARRVDYKHWEVAFAEPPPKPGQKLAPNSDRNLAAMPTEEMMERDWQDAVDGNVTFYQWADPWPTQEDTDIMLIDVRPGTSKNCSWVRATLFDAALKKPRGGFGWAISSSQALPFQFGGRHYQMSETVYSTDGKTSPISWEFSINWVGESTRRREYGQTNICHVRRNMSISK